MKLKFTFLIGILFMVLSCNNSEKKDSNSDVMEVETELNTGLKGAWELVGFYNYQDNKVVDSFKTNPEFRQLKMYTDTKVMWCKHRAADSSEWFGYGTYNYENDTLVEVLDFGSAVMDEVIEEKKRFRFELTLESDRFQQIELDEEGNRVYSENYIRVE